MFPKFERVTGGRDIHQEYPATGTTHVHGLFVGHQLAQHSDGVHLAGVRCGEVDADRAVVLNESC